jgi:hypothetical protein
MRLFQRHQVTPADMRPVTAPASPANIFATPAPAALISRYLVLYDRVGEWGTGATLAPPMLSVCGTTRTEIEDAILRDVRSYLPPGADIRVIVVLGIMAGQIRVGGLGAGTFSLRMTGGGEHR